MYILTKYEQFEFLTHFLKKHQGYSSRFFKKWGSEAGNEIEPIFVRMYVYMYWKSIAKLTVIAYLVLC